MWIPCGNVFHMCSMFYTCALTHVRESVTMYCTCGIDGNVMWFFCWAETWKSERSPECVGDESWSEFGGTVNQWVRISPARSDQIGREDLGRVMALLCKLWCFTYCKTDIFVVACSWWWEWWDATDVTLVSPPQSQVIDGFQCKWVKKSPTCSRRLTERSRAIWGS